MNRVYLYNGSFKSLLILIVELLKFKENPQNIKCEKEYISNLLDETIYLKLNDDNLKILNKLPKKILKIANYVFLSNEINKEIIIFDYIKYAFKYGEKVFSYRNINSINQTIKIVKYVNHEAHKLKGFLRFKQIQNKFYYAEIEPSNNIIEILGSHFKKRLNLEPWIIHDLKRDRYAVYDLKKVVYLTENDILKLDIKIESNEEKYEELWKTFFKTIAIKERKNLKCQMNFMPKKYWKHLIEMEEK